MRCPFYGVAKDACYTTRFPTGMLNASLAHRPSEIDAFLDDTRNEGEVRLVALRAAIRELASNRPDLLDVDCNNSLGDMLAAKPASRAAFDSIMKVGGSARVCLLSPLVRLVNPSEADELDEVARTSCVPVRSSARLAVRIKKAEDPRVVASVPCPGGGRDGVLIATRRGERCIEVLTRSSDGRRKCMNSDGLPVKLLDRLFSRSDAPPADPQPHRKNELPNFLKAALVDFLERRMRLQVLCTARMPAPVSRPVALDHVFLKDANQSKCWLVVEAHLHPSSATCLCGAWKRLPGWSSRVEIKFETCGRALQRGYNGRMQCGLHRDLLDAIGNARHQLRNVCTDATRVNVSCCHRKGAELERIQCVPSMPLTKADRKELALILVGMREFQTRTSMCYNKHRLEDHTSLAAIDADMHARFKHYMQQVETDELSKPATHTSRELLKRDMVAVDMLRAGKVFRHVYKNGARKGHPYLRRAVGGEALKHQETELADTHAHLFRKA